MATRSPLQRWLAGAWMLVCAIATVRTRSLRRWWLFYMLLALQKMMVFFACKLACLVSERSLRQAR